jgi:hypothetical protein
VAGPERPSIFQKKKAVDALLKAGHDEGEHEAGRGNPVAPQKSLHNLSES